MTSVFRQRSSDHAEHCFSKTARRSAARLPPPKRYAPPPANALLQLPATGTGQGRALARPDGHTTSSPAQVNTWAGLGESHYADAGKQSGPAVRGRSPRRHVPPAKEGQARAATWILHPQARTGRVAHGVTVAAFPNQWDATCYVHSTYRLPNFPASAVPWLLLQPPRSHHPDRALRWLGQG